MIYSNTNIKNIAKPSNVIFDYGSGRLVLESNGGYISGIEIHYEGSINHSFQPIVENNTIHGVGNNKIIIANLTDVVLKGELMHYKGYFKITNIIVCDANGKQVGASVYFQNATNKPEEMNMNPEDMNIEPEKMNKGYFYGKYRTKKKTIVLKKQGKSKQKSKISGPVSNVGLTSGDEK